MPQKCERCVELQRQVAEQEAATTELRSALAAAQRDAQFERESRAREATQELEAARARGAEKERGAARLQALEREAELAEPPGGLPEGS